MKKKSIAVLAVLMIPILLSACVRETPERQAEARRKAAESQDSMASNAMASNTANIVAAGKVVETMDVDKYTYVLVDTGSEKVWAAAPKCEVKVGDELAIPSGVPMQNYHSKTLDRDFDLIYFVGSFQGGSGSAAGGGAAGQMPAGHPPTSGHPSMAGSTTPPNMDFSDLKKPEGGMTIEEIYAGKADLADKEVKVRGKVVKYNERIMGKNWLHIQDGSGDAKAATNDLTVTTDGSAKLGDTVLVTGPVHLDKDFGFGYTYPVMIEDAKVTVE